MNGAPQLLAINESFLDKSVKEVTLSGFQLSSRRDRPDGSGGGVVLFVANSAAAYVTLLAHSETCERSWHVLHTDLGPVLFCVWYRPPAPGDFSSIKAFEREWVSLQRRFCRNDFGWRSEFASHTLVAVFFSRVSGGDDDVPALSRPRLQTVREEGDA